MSIQVYEGDGVDPSLLPDPSCNYWIHLKNRTDYQWLGSDLVWRCAQKEAPPFPSPAAAVGGLMKWQKEHMNLESGWAVVGGTHA